MARTVDFENPSDDDLQYLSERTWLIADAELSGNTALRAKVKAYLAGERAAAEEEEQETITYKQAKVEELRAELERRGLSTDGKKDALIARLELDDLTDDDDEEDADEDATPAGDEIPEED